MTSWRITGAFEKRTGLTHEEALRESIVSMLMSPDFCYRIDLDATHAFAAPPDFFRASLGETDSIQQAHGADGQPAVSSLRPGQPAELFPLVQHARSGVAGARRRRRSADGRTC